MSLFKLPLRMMNFIVIVFIGYVIMGLLGISIEHESSANPSTTCTTFLARDLCWIHSLIVHPRIDPSAKSYPNKLTTMILKMPTLTIIHHGYLKKKENIGRRRLRDWK